MAPKDAPAIVVSLHARKTKEGAPVAATCREWGWPRPVFGEDLGDAAALAIKHATEGSQVAMVGDIHAAAAELFEDQPEMAADCIILLCEDYGITIHAVGKTPRKRARVSQVTQSIRSFRAIYDRVKEEIQNKVATYAPKVRKYGRPRIGYRIQHGRLTIDRPVAAGVRTVVSELRCGSTIGDVLKEARSRHPDIYWDHRKLHRIYDSLSLYCRGEYQAQGETVRDPSLAFLPAEWVDTEWPHTPNRPEGPETST